MNDGKNASNNKLSITEKLYNFYHSQSFFAKNSKYLFAFPIIKQNFCDRVWCNARTSAKGFYETMDFESLGDTFEIEGVGPHILMSRKIN